MEPRQVALVAAERFAAGWNWRAVVATLAGGLLAVGGAYTAPGTSGPFPADGLIPAFKGLYDYSWVIGLAVGFAIYLLLSLPVSGRARASAPAAA